MKFGELGTTQDWTDRIKSERTLNFRWLEFPWTPNFLKLVGTLQDSYSIINYRSFHLKQTKEGSFFAFFLENLTQGPWYHKKHSGRPC